MTFKAPSTLTEALTRCRPTPPRPPNVLHSLLIIQQVLGYLPTDIVGVLANTLHVTEADVAGVLSYYPELHSRPMPRRRIRVCMGESCLANHSARVMQAFERILQTAGGSREDNSFGLEAVYCVGNCAVSPTVVIDGETHGRVRASDVKLILEKHPDAPLSIK